MTTQRRRRPPQSQRISDQWLQYVRASVTLSGANTFTQATINLPVVVSQGFVLEAHIVEFSVPGIIVATDLGDTDDNTQLVVQLTKASQSAIIQIDNPDYIYGYNEEFLTPNARTAEQAPVLHHTLNGGLNWQFPEPILLPFEQIFLGANSAGVAVAPTFRCRIGYKTVRLSTRQLPEMIQAVT